MAAKWQNLMLSIYAMSAMAKSLNKNEICAQWRQWRDLNSDCMKGQPAISD